MTTSTVCIRLDPPGVLSLVVTHGALMLAMAQALGADERPFGNLEGQWVEVSPAGIVLGGSESFI